MATFLLEIRTEEIPANALSDARCQLEQLLSKELAEAGFDGCSSHALSTSRRLALVVDDLSHRQPDSSEQVIGPPVRVAFTEDGAPTKAAEGFARKTGLPLEEIERLTTDKGEYLAATVARPGRATADILGDVVPAVVERLRFPKMMRWGRGEHLFVRPVHGVVALLDGDVVPVELYGVASGRTTVGHRVHSPETVEIAAAADYQSTLEAHGVVVDPERRRSMLDSRADELAAAVGLRVHDDDDLVAEHVELVEYPGLLCGAIEERFLELPPEVVVSTLRHHQKCLILETEEGELRPHFLAVIDRRDDPEGLVRQGNEWVIGARLADAGFFFAEDRKTLLVTRADGLSRVEWHRRLGSMADKAQRIGELAGHLSDRVDAGFDVDTLTLIARLAKADLVTHMVGEFPELQGIMGGHYLRLEGEREAVWTAARDHYRPIGFDGELPASVEGRLVGAADRLDTVAALFALGEKPSGSKDPFGLRRAAQGLVRIVAESGWDVALDDVVRTAVVPVAKAADSSTDEVMAAVLEFLASRVRRYLVEVVGVAGDTAEAVMAADWTRLPVLVERAHALEEVRSLAQFRALALAFKRVRNITANQPDGEVDPRLFEHDAESELHRAVETYHRQLSELVPEHRIDEIFRAMEPIASTLDRFFVDVLVMAKDERVRANRIALLKALGRDFLALADLSKLHIEGGEA